MDYFKKTLTITRVILLLLILFSCQTKPVNKVPTSEESGISIISAFLKTTAANFSIATSPITDSNQLICYFRGGLDTTYFVHFVKQKDRIRGIVYVVERLYNLQEPEDVSLLNETQYFEGMTFDIDTMQWRYITVLADSILNIPTDSTKRYEMFDGHSIVLGYKSKFKVNEFMSDDFLLCAFQSYLESNFIMKRLQKKPKWFIVK